MKSGNSTRNFHVPLPANLYERLRREARRSGVPATEIAREGIYEVLRRRQKAAVHEHIRKYASSMAGTLADLDEDLEAAAMGLLRDVEEEG